MTLKTSYPTNAAAALDLIANGFTDTPTGFTKRSQTGGNLFEAPRPCIAIARIKLNEVDPVWNSPNYYTVEFV